jgi:uncharacterized protein YbjT (DUF2867 family)
MILITGATGSVGRGMIQQLLEAGEKVRALTRDLTRANLPDGVELVQGDLSLPETLTPALKGVTAAFLFPVSGSAPAFLEAAKQSGVQKIVLLSSSSVQNGIENHRAPIAAFHAAVERAVEGSGIEWTFLRPTYFAKNTLQWANQIRAGNSVRGAYGEAALAPIHEADIAAVAVEALRKDGHVGAKYQLTGPQSLTQSELVEVIGRTIGRALRFEEIPAEQMREQMVQHLPAPVVDELLGGYKALVGQTAHVTATVAQVTGRPARSFEEWARDHVSNFC